MRLILETWRVLHWQWSTIRSLRYTRNNTDDYRLTHWGRVRHICVNKLINIWYVNILSPGRRQAIVWTNVGILLIAPLGIKFSEILVEIYIYIYTFIPENVFENVVRKLAVILTQPQCFNQSQSPKLSDITATRQKKIAMCISSPSGAETGIFQEI